MPSKNPGKQDTTSHTPKSAVSDGDAFFSQLFESIAKEPYTSTVITGRAAKQLAAKLVSEADGPDDIAESIRAYFALDSRSVEAVLSESRRLVPELYQVGEGRAIALGPEIEIAATVSELNRYCLDKHKLPFHRATLLKQAKSIDGSEPAQKLARLVLGSSGRCPQETYPRYVGSMWPWKLQYSLHHSFRQRPEDSGCNVHMEYKKSIKGWVGMAPAVYLVVAANQWGMKLAANDKALFIKAWTLAPYGFLPPLLALVLPTRKD